MRIPATIAAEACVLCVCICASVIPRAAKAQQQGREAVAAQDQHEKEGSIPPVPVHVQGDLVEGRLVHSVMPAYPTEAKAAHVSGTVVLHAIIAADGSIKELQFISGPPMLKDAAMQAVEQWEYKPYMLNGRPVPVDTTISVIFSLSGGRNSSAEESEGAQGMSSEADATAKPVDAQFKANIMKLLEVTHAMAIGQQAAKTMFAQLRPTLVASLPPTPHREQIVDAYAEKLTALLASQEVTDRLAAVYARHLSPDDVSSMIQFYQTPAGQHALASMPQILAESQQIGSNAAQEGLPRIFGELCTEFPELRGKVKFCPATAKNESGERMEKQWPMVTAQWSAARNR